MPKIREDFLHFIWRYKLLRSSVFLSVSGKSIAVINPGTPNTDAGPDFFNAVIEVDGLRLAGNIEIHVKTSDWLRHGHQQDASYDNIILHVVYEHDGDLEQNIKNNVDVLEVKALISHELMERYAALHHAPGKLACSRQLQNVNGLHYTAWLERMAAERLERKTERVAGLFATFNSDYSQTFYALVLRSFGAGTNALPFELLAKHLPLHLLLKHADNLLQLEALLLGTAGLLEDQFEDSYVRGLQNEFEFLKRKYTLIPLEKKLFKFSTMRPAHFPDARLAQFAALVNGNSQLFSSPHLYTSPGVLIKTLQAPVKGYWQDHYSLGREAQRKNKGLGAPTAEIIAINAFAPFLFFYSKKSGQPQYADAALKIFEACSFEDNVKTRLFAARKSESVSAAQSQALIHLYDSYCSAKRCLHCSIGVSLLKS